MQPPLSPTCILAAKPRAAGLHTDPEVMALVCLLFCQWKRVPLSHFPPSQDCAIFSASSPSWPSPSSLPAQGLFSISSQNSCCSPFASCLPMLRGCLEHTSNLHLHFSIAFLGGICSLPWESCTSFAPSSKLAATWQWGVLQVVGAYNLSFFELKKNTKRNVTVGAESSSGNGG